MSVEKHQVVSEPQSVIAGTSTVGAGDADGAAVEGATVGAGDAVGACDPTGVD